MAQGYYTLSEAAEVVGISVDALRRLAQKGEIRSFQDRGTMRFRSQDIQALAGQRGQSSDPDLTLGTSAPPTPIKSSSPSSAARRAGPQTPSSRQAMPEVFDFELATEEQVDLGADFLRPKSKSDAKKSPQSPPSPGSDSDVRLVADKKDDTSSVGSDVDVMRADTPAPISPMRVAPSSGSRRSAPKSPRSGKQQQLSAEASKFPSPPPGSPQPADSGARLVPMDSDSDVMLVPGSDEIAIGRGMSTSQTDSDVRLDQSNPPAGDSGEGDMQRTEEINLDEEIRKLGERGQDQLPTQMKAKSKLQIPMTSPFELSDSEMKLPSELRDVAGPRTPHLAAQQPADSSDFELTASVPADGSSDFDLTPGPDESVQLAGSDDFSLEASDDHELARPGDSTESTSLWGGISKSDPIVAGAALEGGGEQADEDVDFDLSLSVEDSPKPQHDEPVDDSEDFQLKAADTPKPVESSPVDSSSEFELSLDSDSELPTAEGQEDGGDIDLSLDVEDQPEPTDDSEFEINLDGSDEGDAGVGEFELTLNDSADAELEEAAAAPQVKTKMKASEPEPDIFESDFEVPALDESEDEAAADSELESSDFDLAIDDSEMANEEESGSQVVALDDDEDVETLVDSDEDAAVVDDAEVDEEESDFEQLDDDVEVEDETELETQDDDDEPVGKTVTKTKLVEPAPWGVMPVIFMLPCVVVMFLVGLLGHEMVQSSIGMRPPGILTMEVAAWFKYDLTKKR